MSNQYQPYKSYQRLPNQPYSHNQILSFVDQVLQKSRNNFTQLKQQDSNVRYYSNQPNFISQSDAKIISRSPTIIHTQLQNVKLNEQLNSQNQKTTSEQKPAIIPLIPLISSLKEEYQQKQSAKLIQQQQNNQIKKSEERFRNFTIIKKLGDGKYSQVFLAKHNQTGFLVALKVIQKQQIVEENMQAQLAWEIKIQYLMEHPNITRLFTFFQTEKEIVLVLEYCSHGELYSLLQQQSNQRFSEKQAANYVHQISYALMYMHNNEVIHRDIKPDNILLCFGEAKIADFSFCVYSPYEYRQTQCGTIIYASPEILEGDMYDKKSDIWGLGVLTYELCFGRPPWKEHQQELMKTACFIIPQNASKDLKDFIEKLVQRLSRDRLTAKQAYNHPWHQQTQKTLPYFIKKNEALFQ